MKIGTTPDIRRKKLKRLLRAKNLIRVMEAHNPISAIIVETTNISKNNQIQEFDAIWSSSLTDSVSRGVPDDQTLDYSVRLNGVGDMFNVVTKPLIFDLDNGGHIDHIPRLIKRIETLGISAVIVEDKRGFKQNSLFANQKKSQLEKLNTFTKKIKKIKASQINDDFIMIARIESLILGLGLKDALRRAEAYSKAGADMIMIHSKSKSPNEILKFAKQFQKSNYFKPLVAVPSTYSSITEKKLEDHGFKIVIYANQLLRASFKSMSETAKKILNDQRASRADKSIASINTILNLVK